MLTGSWPKEPFLFGADFGYAEAMKEVDDENQKLREVIAKMREALVTCHNACGVAATMLLFHGGDKSPVKSCSELMKRHDERGADLVAEADKLMSASGNKTAKSGEKLPDGNS